MREDTSPSGRAREEAFASFFRSHVEGVSRLVCRIVGSLPEADDLVQEAFLRSYLRGPQGPDRELRKAWLYRAALNLALNALRGRKRRSRREADAALVEAVAPRGAPLPDETLQRLEVGRMVRRVLRELSRREARILMLRYHGLSYREMSEILQVAPASVGTLLARAERSFEEAYRRAAAGGRPATPGAGKTEGPDPDR